MGRAFGKVMGMFTPSASAQKMMDMLPEDADEDLVVRRQDRKRGREEYVREKKEEEKRGAEGGEEKEKEEERSFVMASTVCELWLHDCPLEKEEEERSFMVLFCFSFWLHARLCPPPLSSPPFRPSRPLKIERWTSTCSQISFFTLILTRLLSFTPFFI